MSRDLTCNESLAEDGGASNNFSPNQNRLNQAQQLFSTNPAQSSLALFREQILQQQNLQNQQQSNHLAASLLRAQQALGSNIDTLNNTLTSNPTSISDASLIAQLQMIQQQQSQQQRQAQLLDRLQSNPSLPALLAQSNLYGAVSGQVPSSLGLTSTASSVDQQTARTSNIQQLAAALGIQIPMTQGVQNENNESIINQLLQQIQAPQLQNTQNVLSNSALQHGGLSQSTLASRLLNMTRNLNVPNNSTQLPIQQQLAEILQSPQILQVARELTEQHSSQAQQFQKQNLSQTSSYSDPTQRQTSSDTVNQYIQRIAAQLPTDSHFQASSQSLQPNVSAASINQSSLASQIQQQLIEQLTNQTTTSSIQQQLPYEHQQLLQQHLNNTHLSSRPNFVSHANSILNNLQNIYLQQRESQTPQQLQQDLPVSQANNPRVPGASPRILKRSRPSSSNTAAGSTNNSQTSIDELRRKQEELLRNLTNVEGQQELLDEYRKLQTLIDAKSTQSQDQNGTRLRQETTNEEQSLQEKLLNPYRQTLDQFYKEQTPNQQQPSNANEPRFIANIPTLAAFRQVPGQDIFEHLPKKRIKQEKQADALSAAQRKQAKTLEVQTKKTKGAYKKLHNGSSNSTLNQQYLRDEPINIDNDDFENFPQRPNNSLLPRKRGRPRTTAVNNGKSVKSSQNLVVDNIFQNQTVSPTRTILHEAVDIFLKPSLPDSNVDRSAISPAVNARKRVNRKSKNLDNEQLLSKINTLAAAINMTSPQDSELLSPTDLNSSGKDSVELTTKSKKPKSKFNIKSAENQLAIKEFREKHPELSEMSELEIFGVKAIVDSIANQQTTDKTDSQKNAIAHFVANSLQKSPNFWNILHRIPKNMLPNELQIVDHVFNHQHILDLAKVDLLTSSIIEKSNEFPMRSRPLFRDLSDANDRKNVQLMAMNLSFANRRIDFAKSFIYESTLVRLLNGEYKDLRGENIPQELFIEEPTVYNRIRKQYGQAPPDFSKSLNCAQVESKLLNQMYRYRSQFFNEVHNRPFVLAPQKRLTPDAMIILNMDVTKTLFNVVDSVSTENPYVTFEEESKLSLKNVYPSEEDFHRLAFKTIDSSSNNNQLNYDPTTKRTVILKAKQKKNEADDLKQRLQSHLSNNFKELLKVHDSAYKIRCRAIELHRNDMNQMITSIQRSIHGNSGRRSASVQPLERFPTTVPLYKRRRSRSLDIGVQKRVVNLVGVDYLENPLIGETLFNNQDDQINKEVTFGPKEYHELWESDGFKTLSEHFDTLLTERQQLIAALIKLTLLDQDSRAIIEAACEKNVAVNTNEYKIDGAKSRKNRIKSSISMAQSIKRLPHLNRLHLLRRFKKHRLRQKSPIAKLEKDDFNWWYLQMLNGNLEDSIENADRRDGQLSSRQQSIRLEKQRLLRQKERNKFVAMCRRMQEDNAIIPYSPSLYIRDKNFIIESLSERAFNNELSFRHLKCVALKFYSNLDSERHAQFVKKLEKLEAPRLDVVLKMRNDLTVGYLYELPTYELRSHAQQKHKGHSIKVTPNSDVFDDMFGGKTKNPYRQPLLFPVTTSQFEINSAQLTKYRNREMDGTPAEKLINNMNLTTCARALMRLIYQSPKYGNELAIFMSHPAFKIFDTEQGDQNGFPTTVYQMSIKMAVEQNKPPVEKRKMPDFKNNEEAEQYFKERQKSMKEKLASILTTAHRNTVLSRRCIKTMRKLVGVEKNQKAKVSLVRQHYNSLSTRSKSQFVKRYRMERFNESTQLESDVRPEDNLKAPLVVPGFTPLDAEATENAKSLKLPTYVRNDILSPPKLQSSSSDDLRSSMRGGKMSRGRGGRRIRRAGKY